MSIFSLATVTTLVELITGGTGGSTVAPIGRYRTGAELQVFFGQAGLHLDLAGVSRVPATRDLLVKVNNEVDGLEPLKRIVEQVADPREYAGEPEKVNTVVERLNNVLQPDGYVLRPSNGRYQLEATAHNSQVAEALVSAAKRLDLDSVYRDFDRALGQADHDPEDAITAACSTVESVCKCLLDEMGWPYPARQEVQPLVWEVQKNLKLSQPEVAQDLRQILGGLTSVVVGVGALRTHTGDAHGRGIDFTRPDPRMARFAIHAASTIAVFLVESWEAQRPRP